MTTITINFDGAPPVVGGAGLGDRVPPGGYVMTVKSVSKATTTTGKDMIKTEYSISQPAAFANKRIMENFVLPRPGTDDSKFGLQRFHALIVALGGSNMDGRGNQNLELERLVGQTVVSEIGDSIIPANGNYPEKTVSAPVSYLKFGSEEANTLLSVAVPQAAPAPTPAPAPVAAAPAPVAAAAPAPAPVAQDNSVEDELDGLFG